MSKSQVSALLHVLRGIRKDIQAAYPGMQSDLERDFERIALYSVTRGLGFYTLDLPHLESLLIRGLEDGRLSLDGPISTRVSKRIHVPRLFAGLWLRVFNRDASLKHDVDVTALFFLRQLLGLGKKLEVGCSPHRTSAVLRSYHDIEFRLRRPTLAWDDDDLCREHTDFWQLSLTQCVPPVDELPILQWLHKNSHCGWAASRDLRKDGRDSYRESDHSDQRCLGARRDKRYLERVQQVADLLIGSMEQLDPVWFSGVLDMTGQGIGFKHGPGAVAERLKQWEKSHFPNWPHKLERVFPYKQCGSTSLWEEGSQPPNHEVASRLITVPKTSKAPRLIAAEPTSHQWCQQLLLRFLFDQSRVVFGSQRVKEPNRKTNFVEQEDNLKADSRKKKPTHVVNFIDFKNQGPSGEMVLTSSLDRKLATVDLSEASDRLSCWTVERIFRSNPSILIALHAARTRYLRDDISAESSSFIKLKKFASQGTATTFPVMSLTMLCIALGASIKGRVTWSAIRELTSQVRVFGDDIIIPSHGYERLVRIMDLLQLKVNVAKSYVKGNFRESCGVDGFLGYDVTPVRPKTIVADSPASCQAVIDTSNNLFNKGLWYASAACYDLLPARLRRGIRIVGRNDARSPGLHLKSNSGSYESHLAKRWNSRFHRYEVRVWTLSVRTEVRPREGLPTLLDFVASKHNPEHVRIVSEFRNVRKTRVGLQWEPSNLGARRDDGLF